MKLSNALNTELQLVEYQTALQSSRRKLTQRIIMMRKVPFSRGANMIHLVVAVIRVIWLNFNWFS